MALLTDSWALGLAGKQNSTDFLDLAQATPLSADPQVWGTIANVYGHIERFYQGDAMHYPHFVQHAVKRLAPVLAQLGWQGRADDADAVSKLRSELIATLGTIGDPAVIAEARRRYGVGDAAALPGNLRRTIMTVVAQHADSATWETLHRQAKAEKTPLLKDQLYTLLAHSHDKTLAQRALELALTDEPGATNSASMISTVARRHPDLAFDFAVAHIAKVDTLVDASSRSRFYARLAKGSKDKAMLARLQAYAKAHLAPSARADVRAAASSIETSIKVRRERLPAIGQWLTAHAN
jgi:aminopeptidase N